MGRPDRSLARVTRLAGACLFPRGDPRGAAADPRQRPALRQALEVILNSRSEVAIVLEGNHRYLGSVTVESIRKELG